MVKYLLAICLLSVGIAVEGRMAFRFAAGIDNLIQEIDETFTCDDKSYGYYADVQNECKIFHVCNPIMNEDGEVYGNLLHHNMYYANPQDLQPHPVHYLITNVEFRFHLQLNCIDLVCLYPTLSLQIFNFESKINFCMKFI